MEKTRFGVNEDDRDPDGSEEQSIALCSKTSHQWMTLKDAVERYAAINAQFQSIQALQDNRGS